MSREQIECLTRFRVQMIGPNRLIRNHLGGIKVSQTYSPIEIPPHRLLYRLQLNFSVLERGTEIIAIYRIVSQVQIRARVHADSGCILSRRHVVMRFVHHAHAPIVRAHGNVIAAELLAKYRPKEEFVRAIGSSVGGAGTSNRTVGRHDLTHFRSDDLGLECRQIGIVQIVHRRIGYEVRSIVVASAVNDVVLRAGDDFQVVRIVAFLETSRIGDTDLGQDVRILPERLFRATPSKRNVIECSYFPSYIYSYIM